MANKNLNSAKTAKNDEFYTQNDDIVKEVNAYLEYNKDVFRGKTILLPCDDPYESNFFKFFANRFNEFGIKKLIATSYATSPIQGKQFQSELFDAVNTKDEQIDKKATLPNKKAYVIEINELKDFDNDGTENILDIKHFLEKNPPDELKGDNGYLAGDFRSNAVCELRQEADIIITNPPFSLFREFLKWINPNEKKFLIIGNMNAITYKEVFPLIKENVLWLGPSISSGDREFEIPEHYETSSPSLKIYTDKEGVVQKRTVRVPGVRWFTNLDHGRRHQPLSLMTMADNLKYNAKKFEKYDGKYAKYDNYDAIEVPEVKLIPSDYDGVMGVPISFLDKYNPEQFEIVKFRHGNDGKDLRYTRERERELLHTSEFSSSIYENNGMLSNPKQTKVNGISKYARIGIIHRRHNDTRT